MMSGLSIGVESAMAVAIRIFWIVAVKAHASIQGRAEMTDEMACQRPRDFDEGDGRSRRFYGCHKRSLTFTANLFDLAGRPGQAPRRQHRVPFRSAIGISALPPKADIRDSARAQSVYFLLRPALVRVIHTRLNAAMACSRVAA